MANPFDAEVELLGSALPPGPRLVVIGGTAFWGDDSARLCEAAAGELAGVVELVAMTGGVEGVGRTFGRAFAASRRAAGRPEYLFHLLPRGATACDSGITLHAGDDFGERREVLGRVGDVYLVVEGGPGTEHEAAVAAARGVPVIPLGRTGGHAGALFPRTRCPSGVERADWEALNDAAVPHDVVVAAVGRVVRNALSRLVG